MRFRFVILLVLASVLAAACGGGSVENQPDAAIEYDASNLISGPVPAPSLGYELGREELIATDPGSVQIEAGYPQLIELFAFWWEVCQGMAPVVHGLEDKYSEYLRFSYLDIDDPANEAIREFMGHEYRWRPFIFLVNSQGEVIDFYIGFTPAYTLEEGLVDFLVGEGVFEK